MKVQWVALFILLGILVLVLMLPYNLGVFIALLLVTLVVAVWAIRSLSVKLTRPSDDNQNYNNGDYNDNTSKIIVIILSHCKRIIKRLPTKCK